MNHKNVTIRNMPIDLWTKIKARAVLTHKDLSFYVIELLKKAVENNK